MFQFGIIHGQTTILVKRIGQARPLAEAGLALEAGGGVPLF